MCVDYVLASPRITQVDPGDEPLPEVVLSHLWLLQRKCGESSGDNLCLNQSSKQVMSSSPPK
jgi:hypothetical protein